MHTLFDIIEEKGNTKDWLILKTLYSTGCRVAELCNLRVKDVHFKRPGKNVVVNIKNGKGGKNRNVNITRNLSIRLKQYLN